MDDAQQNHLKAYGLTYNAIKAGVTAEWLLNYRGGSFLLADTPELRRQAGLGGSHHRAGRRRASSGRSAREIAASNMESRAAREGAEDRRLHAARRAAVGRRGDARAQVRRASTTRRSTTTRCERGDLTKYDWLHLHHEDFTGQLNKFYLDVSRRALVHRSAAEEHGGGEAARVRQHSGAQEGRGREDPRVRRPRRISVRDVRRHRDARAGDRRRRTSTSRRRSSTARRWIPTPTRRWTGSARSRSRTRTSRVAVRELDERHRRAPGERARPAPAARHVHAVQLLGEDRSGDVDARAESSRGDQRLLRRDDELQQSRRSSRASRSSPTRRARRG